MRLNAIGGSDAGIAVALRARELDPGGQVTVLVADEYPNFSICGIPYLISGEVGDCTTSPTAPAPISPIPGWTSA
jgi:NADPH-dependent 2,4-dienoyl-CoA reductase/sulfur reductase-like enzyme